MNTEKPTVLIVDDDEEIRSQLKWAIAGSYQVVLAENRETALEAFRTTRPAVVLLDLGLPPAPASPEQGMALLAELLTLENRTKIIILSGQSDRANALRAIHEGAYDFLGKPPEIEELKVVLRRATEVVRMERELAQIHSQRGHDVFEGMIGTSPQMQTIFSTIRRVASSDAPVLLLGESGTGKEMAARAVHRLSPRRDAAFVAINCGAIPEALLESELFGHEKGSFTGAHAQRLGKIETANGGTLFLDEIGELPLALQVKLLRFLQEQKIERIGGRREIDVDVRVVAATNVDLGKATQEGKFREDLFYRVAVVSLRLPPLRERIGDIPVLAQQFLARFANESGKGELRFGQAAARALAQHAWPGNVRELENRIRRAVIMADGSTVKPTDLELLGNAEVPAEVRGLKEAREEVERQMIEEALRKNGGKISPAAAELGISRPTLYELMEKLNIRRSVA